ncbi:hypothetical protein ACHAW5_003347 [Stephanodiscus triporus]|uniref:NUC153 domain-containing protein n=1 Tax=Stephanodiscus triporus TaxID=2934178 RepID=A0ABD3MY79_9STRA
MEIQERRSGKIYSLASSTSVPEWLSERSRRNLSRRDANYRRRISLLQDLDMPISSSKIRQSTDGNYLLVSGTYAPRIRCYELSEMSMKFERYVDSEVVDMCVLGSDYGKLAILGADRSVTFHAPYGNHEKVRLPTFGRAMAYEMSTCDLMVVGSRRRRVGGGGGGARWTILDAVLVRVGLLLRDEDDDGHDARRRVVATRGAARARWELHSHLADPFAVRDRRRGRHGPILGQSRSLLPAAPGGADCGPDEVLLTPFLNLDVSSAISSRGRGDDGGGGAADGHVPGSFPGEVTSLCFDDAGMRMCAGTRGGNVALYDMRSSRPLFVKEHQYGLPIHTVQFHSGSGTVLSSDPKLVKIWNARGGSSASNIWSDDDGGAFGVSGGNANDEGLGGPLGTIVANVEGTADFTHFITSGDSSDPSGQRHGLLLCAGEQSKVQSFYCPVLGAAPRWCSFLDNITEELEEKDGVLLGDPSAGGADDVLQTETVYEDYKFLTRAEIDKLGIQNLVGTPLLRGYMHGFFIHVGLYNRIRAVAKPFEYSEYRSRKIKERMEEKRASRIAPKVSVAHKTKAKVNPDLADRLQAKAGDRTKAGKVARALESDSDDDGFMGGKVREVPRKEKKNEEEDKTDKKEKKKKKKTKVVMYEADDFGSGANAVDIGLGNVSAEVEANKRKKEMSLTMADRLRLQSEQSKFIGETKRLRVAGQGPIVKEVTFIPKSTKKKAESEERVKREAGMDDRSGRNRRGVKSLGLKTPFKHHR